MQKIFSRPPGRSKPAMSWTVFSMYLKSKVSCAKFLAFFSGQELYGGYVRKSWRAQFRAGALASKLPERNRLLLLQFCSLIYGLDTCSRPVALISTETQGLPHYFLVRLCGTYSVGKGGLGAKVGARRAFVCVIRRSRTVGSFTALLLSVQVDLVGTLASYTSN